ncbi:MAG: hypothetical protein C0498_13555 [Anaerolinea sp.]|nr:hypothetical protein [Anaerolinea sp.]
MSQYRFDVSVDENIENASHDRVRRSGRRVVIAGAVATLVVVVIASAAVVMPGSSQAPFASWRAAPMEADSKLARDAATACLAGPATGARWVVQDQRGAAAALLFLQGPDLVTCVAGRGARGGVDAVVSARSRIDWSLGRLAVVTGTVSQGYFLAWWPSEAKAIAIRAIDAFGRGIGEISDLETSQP